MGMSASQVRFLSLQSRKHDIGRQLTALSNRKMALSRDMNKVSKNYTNALNQKTLKWSNDSGATYQNLSYGLMMKPNSTNTAVPYIVSTRDGKVIVDNNADLLDNYRDSEHTMFDTSAETYQSIAQFISTYQDSTLGITGGSTYLDSAGNLCGTANKGAYVIPSDNSKYGYDKSLRMQCLQKVGIFTSAEITKYNNVMEQLYGPSSAAGLYSLEDWLGKFDEAGTTSLTESVMQGSTPTTLTVNYSDLFGTLSTGDSWSIVNGKSALGDLALAKAYQKEYQVYLNTPIHKGTMTQVDNTKELEDAGISKRIMDVANTNGTLLSMLNNITFDEETFNTIASVTTGETSNGGKKNHYSHHESDCIGLQYMDGTSDETDFKNGNNTSQWATGINVWSDTKNLNDNAGNNAIHVSDLSWGKMYDVDATSNPISTLSDGAIGYSITLFSVKKINGHYGIDLKDTTESETQKVHSVVDALVTGYAKALQTAPDKSDEVNATPIISGTNDMASVQKQALAFAQEKTFNVFTTTPVNESDSPSKYYNSLKSAAARANENFGLGYDRRKHEHQRYYAINPGNVMKVFNTFYNMYMDAAATYIKEGHDLNPNVHSTYGDYDSRVLNDKLTESTTFGLSDANQSVIDDHRGSDILDINSTLEKDISWSGNSGKYAVLDGANYKGYMTYEDHVVEVTGFAPGTQNYAGRTLTYTYSEEEVTSTNADGSYNYTTVGRSYTITYDTNGNATKLVDEDNDVTDYYTNLNTYSGSRVFGDYTMTDNVSNVKAHTSGTNEAGKTFNTYRIEDSKGARNVTIYSDGIVSEEYDSGKTVIMNQNFTSTPLMRRSSGANSRNQVYRVTIDSTGTTFEYYNGLSGTTHTFAKLASGDLQNFQDASNDRVYAYHYSNDDEVYDILCNGGDSAHSDVLTSKLATSLIVYPEDLYSEQIDSMVTDCQNKVDSLYQELDTIFSSKSKVIDYFDAIFQRISENGWQADNKVADNREYLSNKLQNNEYFVTVCMESVDNDGYSYTNKSAGTVNKIYEVNDDNQQNEALSKYEAEKNLISTKEKKVDLIMQKLETEQEAVNTELDAVQKVENENIEKTFKIFA